MAAVGLHRFSTTSPTAAGPLSNATVVRFNGGVGGGGGHTNVTIPGRPPVGSSPPPIAARPTITDAYYDPAGRPTATVRLGSESGTGAILFGTGLAPRPPMCHDGRP